MANKNRQKRAARKARQEKRQRAQATQEAQLAAEQSSKKAPGSFFNKARKVREEEASAKRAASFPAEYGATSACDPDTAHSAGSTERDTSSLKNAPLTQVSASANSIGAGKTVETGGVPDVKTGKRVGGSKSEGLLDNPLTKAEKRASRREAAQAKKAAKAKKRNEKRLSALDKKLAAAQKEVQRTKIEQEKATRALAEEKKKGTAPSKKIVRAAAMAEVRADEALGRATKLQEKKKTKEKNLNLWQRFVRVLTNIKSEMKRVVWPTKRELRNYTIAVIVLLVIFGLIVWGIDIVVVKGLVKFADVRNLIGG